jgi:4-alpha-glucanotransferase
MPEEETPGADPLSELSLLLGIEAGYSDNWGAWHETSPETRAAIFGALGIADPARALDDRRDLPWSRFIEPVHVVTIETQPPALPIHLPLREGTDHQVMLRYEITDEGGRTDRRELIGVHPTASAVIGGERYVRLDLPNETNREIGYYEIAVTCITPSQEFRGSSRLVVSPGRCHIPETPAWGLTLNLYALRSEHNWGVGDLTDLADLARWAAQDLHAGFVGINPLHAIPNNMPYGISPYSSSSRLYRNFLYIDVARAPGAADGIEPARTEEIEALRALDLIDYEHVARAKDQALREAYAAFRDSTGETPTPEWEEFRRYVAEEGRLLEDFATFQALAAHILATTPDAYGWREWPEEYRDPRSPSVAEFRETRREEVEYHAYLQWVLDRQMREVARALEAAPVGLYQDLAVGSSESGSDAWGSPGVFAFGLDVGAPPDAFNLGGQNWGFPPLNPIALRESGYELFIQTIRKNLRYAGALRIDHALGLFRLFVIPKGAEARHGAYLRFPTDEMLKIIALESVRARAAVIAEDLGTIGPEVREGLLAHCMLTYRLFYFERHWDDDLSFRAPEEYPELAFAAVTTHDLPTLRGYWSAHDVEVRNSLGMYPTEDAREKDIWQRGVDRQLMLDALRPLLPEDFPASAEEVPEMTEDLLLAIHRHLARTPARMVAVSFDDTLSVLDQQNMPGTIDTHPNWRQKLPISITDIPRTNIPYALARIFRDENR